MAKFRIGLDKWIAEALNDPDKDAPCSAIGLFHQKSSGTAEEIHVTHVGGAADAKQIAELMHYKANTFAGGLTGVQTFRVGAFYGENPDTYSASYVLMVNGATEAGEGLATEGPTTSGMTAQMMRHNEALMQQVFQHTGRMFERMDRMVDTVTRRDEQQGAYITRLQTENFEAWEFAKKLVLMRHEEDAADEMKRLEYARSTEERAKLVKMIPALANTALGREIFPQSTADTTILESILERVNPEQLMMAAQVLQLPEEVMAPLMSRAVQLEEKKKKEAEQVQEGKALALGAGDE